MSRPFVSIITPSYNAANLLPGTIQSVINQSFQDWEMLIIDDCSTDNSKDIIESFCTKDPRIHYFKTTAKSGSPSLPRNIGIENAKGKYIAFLDADDIWLPNKLELQVGQMELHNWDLSYSFYEKMDWEGKRKDRIIKTRKTTTYNDLLKSNSIPCLTSMITRSAIGETRFRQIPQEDFCFWLDILKKGYTAFNLCIVTALYREAINSRSSNKLDMFKGYWNVIRNFQDLSLLRASYCMITYSAQGFLKYIK